MKPLQNYPDLLTVNDLAAIFKVSTKSIRKEIHSGRFGQPIRIGTAFLIPKIYILKEFFAKFG